MFELKDYQKKALAALDDFFRKVRTLGLEAAWQDCAPVLEKNAQAVQAKYEAEALGEVPAVCVRIPTGGGKTFLAAHAVAKIGKTFRDTAAPAGVRAGRSGYHRPAGIRAVGHCGSGDDSVIQCQG